MTTRLSISQKKILLLLPILNEGGFLHRIKYGKRTEIITTTLSTAILKDFFEAAWTWTRFHSSLLANPTLDGVYIATEMASKAFTDMTLKLIHE